MDNGLLALAARAETTEVGPAAVEALEEVAELLARAYATTHPAVLLAQVRRRAGEVAALLDRRSTLAQRRRLLVVGGWLALLGATLHVDLGDRIAAVAGAHRRGVARTRDQPPRDRRVGGGDRGVDGTDRPGLAAGHPARRRR